MACSVSEAVVARGLCIGCGICAAVCPESTLETEFNRYGELVARESAAGGCRLCGRCLSVCPFSPQAENEDVLARLAFRGEPGLRWLPETGFHSAGFAGYVGPEERRRSRSSGGLASWFLSTLLTRGLVDRVVCVGWAERQPFAYRAMTTDEEVQGSSRSGYYPVSLDPALREIRAGRDRVAIIGLPCVVKGVRLAMKQDPQLELRIRVLAGLVCGGTRSRFYAEYLCALGGGVPQALERVDFRVKEGSVGAGEFGFRFYCRADSGRTKHLVTAQARGRLWSQRYFEPQACRFCDDVFAETADVAFMDAWLERYLCDPRGANLVLTRRAWVSDLLRQAAADGDIALADVPVADVIRSQQDVIHRKRELLEERLSALADTSSLRKRVRPVPIDGPSCVRLRNEERLIARSREAFADALKRSEAPAEIIRSFKHAMRGPELWSRLVNRFARATRRGRAQSVGKSLTLRAAVGRQS
jgi:coenzyme F420-reducing hydrogenase beta subunit